MKRSRLLFSSSLGFHLLRSLASRNNSTLVPAIFTAAAYSSCSSSSSSLHISRRHQTSFSNGSGNVRSSAAEGCTLGDGASPAAVAAAAPASSNGRGGGSKSKGGGMSSNSRRGSASKRNNTNNSNNNTNNNSKSNYKNVESKNLTHRSGDVVVNGVASAASAAPVVGQESTSISSSSAVASPLPMNKVRAKMSKADAPSRTSSATPTPTATGSSHVVTGNTITTTATVNLTKEKRRSKSLASKKNGTSEWSESISEDHRTGKKQTRVSSAPPSSSPPSSSSLAKNVSQSTAAANQSAPGSMSVALSKGSLTPPPRAKRTKSPKTEKHETVVELATTTTTRGMSENASPSGLGVEAKAVLAGKEKEKAFNSPKKKDSNAAPASASATSSKVSGKQLTSSPTAKRAASKKKDIKANQDVLSPAASASTPRARKRTRNSDAVSSTRSVAASASLRGSAASDAVDDELTSQRAGVMKLFMIADALSSVLQVAARLRHETDIAKTSGEEDVEGEEEEEDGITTATAAKVSDSKPQQSKTEQTTSHIRTAASASTMRESDMHQLLIEDGGHSMIIHVRDLEQLSPPNELVATNRTAVEGGSAPSQSVPANGSSVSGDASTTPSPLAEEERVKLLCKWQREAIEATRASQKLWKVPSHCHTITRVRFNNPKQEDVTVVQGSEADKTLVELMRVLEENELVSPETMLYDHSGNGDGDAARIPASSALGQNPEKAAENFQNALATLSSLKLLSQLRDLSNGMGESGDALGAPFSEKDIANSTEHELRAWLGKPLLVKPLLTVFACTIPRREKTLGVPVGESGAVAYVARQRKNVNLSTVGAFPTGRDESEERIVKDVDQKGQGNLAASNAKQQDAALALTTSLSPLYMHNNNNARNTVATPGDPSEDAYWQEMNARQLNSGSSVNSRRFPPLPKYSTRITILEEHEEVDSIEILALADSSISLNPITTQTNHNSFLNTRKKPKVYCLIQDGGKSS